MPKAHEVATELRKLADGLDRIDPALDIPTVLVNFPHGDKESFIAFARVMPRPIEKVLEYPGRDFAEIRLKYRTPAINLWSGVPQSKTCTLVEPAKPAVYRCDPILSEEENAEMENSNG